MLTWQNIETASRRLNGIAHRTPVLHSRQFDEQARCSVYFKAENLQRAGSFKFRGAYNMIRALMERQAVPAVVAYSSGNHAQAVALTAKLLEIPATIVMPQDAPESKVAATKEYGAKVVFYDRYKENREEIGMTISRRTGAILIPPYDDELILAGQATAAWELLQEIPAIDIFVSPVSGGGLLAGSATAAKHIRPQIQIYGVEPESGNDTYLSFQQGERVSIDVPKTIADGLQTNVPGSITFPINQKLAEGILLVRDPELIDTLTFILDRMKVLVEPSGAAAAAAIKFRKADFTGKKVGVILSGGNVDLKKLVEYWNSRTIPFTQSAVL
jgi:threo-3-hydroxy-L-aspartate ammonia-lyase